MERVRPMGVDGIHVESDEKSDLEKVENMYVY